MIEEHQERPGERPLTTRRAMIANNAKAAVTIAAGAVVANLATIVSAKAAIHPPCFLRGTKIKTVDGERCIEDLAIGDLLPTALAGVQPVQWVGSWRVKKSGESWQRFARPVRIAKSALAPNVPHTDLYVTQGHALFIDGLLVTAGSLVNDTTIALDGAHQFDELEYFHIKLARHGVIFAEGAACETLRWLPETAGDACLAASEAEEADCAPVVSNGAISEVRSRMRSMLSPVLGPQPVDLIRARLEQNAMAL